VSATDVAPSPPSRDELLASARRLDWRFLLPDPELGRVVCVGDADDALVDALRRFSASLEVEPVVGPPGSFDVAVAVDPSAAQLAEAARLLRPGGWLYAELGRARRRRTLRALAPLGFGGVALHGHWPDIASATEIVPLADRHALRLALSRHLPRCPNTLVRPAAALARPLAPRLARRVSVVARLDPSGAGGAPVAGTVTAWLAEHGSRLGLATGGSCLLLTPRFRASASVVALVAPTGGEPAIVVKVPRLADGDPGLEREADNLRAAHGSRPGAHGSIPEVLAHEPMGRRAVLAETALAGRALDPGVVRRDPEAAVALVSTWLLDRVRDDVPPDGREVERLVSEPLRRFGRALPGEADLVAATAARVASLTGAALPAVVEHGDLSHPNLLVADGALGVVDWELAEPRGLPLHDLYFFLAYVAFARRRARRLDAQVAAFDEAFRPGGWGRTAADDHARRLGLDRDLLGALFVACWARYTVGLLGRLTADGRPVSASTAAWLRANRWYVLWQRALASGGW
jgi:aminoglycoside phosphotransferase